MTNEQTFDIFRKAYPGSKRGLEVEFDEFIYSCRSNSKQRRLDWRKEIERLLPALNAEIAFRRVLRNADTFCPPWKDLPTWLHGRCWTRDIPEKRELEAKPTAQVYVACGNCDCKQYRGVEGLYLCGKCGEPL